MSIRCAARYTMSLDLPEKPFITFCCEREAHEDNKHFTTGKDGGGQSWKMSWTEKKIEKDKDKSTH